MLGGGLLGTPGHQRVELAELAEKPETAEAILRWNFARVGGPQMSDFYFDPHVKHYTGKQNVLKGWCPKIRWADKVMHADFAHTANGQPVYLENTDNYEDMRQRFKGFEARFRATLHIPAGRTLSWTIDRGIFGREIFDWVLDSPHIHLITWEKGYRGDGWPPGQAAQDAMSVERPRNHSADLRSYHFEWLEAPWPNNPKLRRIIVRATNPEGAQIEVSILTDDNSRPANEIVWLMFDRWVQENDFKYLDEHFGLNQITSYLSQTYAEIRAELQDREMKNAAYTALQKALWEQEQRLGKLLLKERRSQQQERPRQERIAKLEAKDSRKPSERLELGRLKGARKSAQAHRAKRATQIHQIEAEIDRLKARLEQTCKAVSRLETLVGKGAVRLCGERKHLMDVIKITARNLFYEALQPFKEAYDNFRDDHVWFRHLSHSAGMIVPAGPQLAHCHLIGAADFPKPVRRIIIQLLAQFNQSAPILPDGSKRRIELILTPKSAIQLAIANR
jgi:hypothetical protein